MNSNDPGPHNPHLEPARIAILSLHTSPIAALGGKKTGGMNVYVQAVGRELGRRGYQVDIFTRVDDPAQVGQVVEYSPNARVIYLLCGPPAPLNTDQIALAMNLNQFRDETLAFVAQQGYQYDFIYSHYWLSGWVAVHLRQHWKIPVAQMFHTLGRMKSRIALLQNDVISEDARIRGETEVIRRVDRIIAATPAERSQLLLMYRADRRIIDIVPPGVDVTHFRPDDREAARERIGWRPDCRYLLFVGRIEPLKGVDNILEAIAKIKAQAPQTIQDLCLSIIGGDPRNGGDEMQRLQTLTQALDLDDYVDFAGAQNQAVLPDYYRAAEAVIMPSDYESFGMVALEAMACGTPVIASEVGGLAYLIEDGITGYHVPVRAPDILAERILYLLDNPQERDMMGQAAHQVAQTYRWSRIVDQLLETFMMLGTRPKVYRLE